MAIALKRFTKKELVISEEEARRILLFFFPNDPIDLTNITDADRSFAQALLLEAIEASREISYVQLVWEEFQTPPKDFGFIKELAKKFVKKVMVDWFRHATGEEIRDPKIYLMVRSQLSSNFSSAWKIRLQTGDLDY